MSDKIDNSGSDSQHSDGGTVEAVFDVVTEIVTESSIPAPIRRNALKAFAQLCSAAIEVPVAYLEGIAAEKRAEAQARVKIINTSSEQIANQMKVDPVFARMAVKKYGQKIIREQVNLDMVSSIAAKELPKISSSNNPKIEEQNTQSINDDWLNAFEKEASQKSTEEMQLLFGRILAGEIQKPSSFSIKTVKLIGEIDSRVATLFQRLCSACVILSGPYGVPVIDARVISLGGNAGRNSLQKYGLSFSELNILHEYGLVISDYNSSSDYKLCIIDKTNRAMLGFLHQGKQWALTPTNDRDNSQAFMLQGVMLSRAGKELLKIVDTHPMDTYTKDMVDFFAKNNLKMTEIRY